MFEVWKKRRFEKRLAQAMRIARSELKEDETLEYEVTIKKDGEVLRKWKSRS